MTLTTPRSVIVKIDDAYLDRIGDVVAKLQTEGFVLASSLDAIGVLSGSVADSDLKKIASVEGVAAVEDDRSDYRPLST
jgi:hypothetical protein